MSKGNEQTMGLVADVGGTNIRMALAHGHAGLLHKLRIYPCQKFSGIIPAINHYLTEINTQINQAVIALAGPVNADFGTMTNLGWEFSRQAIEEAFQLKQVQFINDFSAIALAIPQLRADQKIQLTNQQPQPDQPIAVCGPGTGLGVAHLIFHQGRWLALPGEGGHQGFAPQNEQEIELLRFLLAKFNHASLERLLSGPGLENIYQALASKTKHAASQRLTAPQITEQALSGVSPLCQDTLALFCRILGSFTGDLALTLATHGGVYLAGGIVPRIADYLRQDSEFLSCFVAKGRFRSFVEKIPVFIISEPYPGLLGATTLLP